jgi:TolB-like protein/DNA-binding winged helix-turn-helix (wHTH) protein/Flp pilus assembly protein TadD
METLARRIVRFGAFEVDTLSGELREGGRRIRAPEQSFQVLALLLDRAGEVVTREELRQRLWPAGTFVDFDAGLNNAVRKLRDALGDSAEIPRYIETLPRRGYRLLAAVEAQPLPAPEEADATAPVRPVAGLRSRGVAALVTAVTAVLVLLALAATGDRWRAERSGPVQVGSIAVLPFVNLSGDPEQDYFVDGMTDAVITNLAQVRALRVISRTSVMHYKRTSKLLPRIADELQADAVVEGTVTRAGDHVRVTAQLIHASTDRHLWARSYERELRDVLALQAELAGAIAQAVEVKLRPEESRRLAVRATVNAEAYDAYLKGRFFLNRRGPRDIPKAVEYFQQAIGRDPKYAPAYSGLSDAHRMFGLQGLSPRECMPKAEAAARKALALDDTLAEAHASLAGVLYRYQWDWEGAEREFRLGLELDPNYAEGHRAYAMYLLTVRRNEEAVAAARRARALSPLSMGINVELGSALVRVGRYGEAIEHLHKTLELNPKNPSAHAALAAAYDGQGDRARAVAMLEKAVSLSGGAANPWLGYAYGITGRRREALEILSRLETRSHEHYVTPQDFAVVHLGLGDKDQAFVWLEKAYEDRAFEVLGFSGLLFDRLSDDPRFQDLLRRMRLPVPTGGPRTAAENSRSESNGQPRR